MVYRLIASLEDRGWNFATQYASGQGKAIGISR
jgi:hypothetical protein